MLRCTPSFSKRYSLLRMKYIRFFARINYLKARHKKLISTMIVPRVHHTRIYFYEDVRSWEWVIDKNLWILTWNRTMEFRIFDKGGNHHHINMNEYKKWNIWNLWKSNAVGSLIVMWIVSIDVYEDKSQLKRKGVLLRPWKETLPMNQRLSLSAVMTKRLVKAFKKEWIYAGAFTPYCIQKLI